MHEHFTFLNVFNSFLDQAKRSIYFNSKAPGYASGKTSKQATNIPLLNFYTCSQLFIVIRQLSLIYLTRFNMLYICTKNIVAWNRMTTRDIVEN